MGPTESLSTLVRECAEQLCTEGADVLGRLYDLTSQRLVRYAIAILGNQHDAEDAVQATLTKIAAQPHKLHLVEHPWPYMLQMVRNESLQTIRKRKRLAFLPDLRDLLTRCPVDQLEQEDRYRAIWVAIRRLPRDQAEVVVLKIWEEMTFAQIGEFLAISHDTAASRYRYAMRRLSAMLASNQKEALYG